MDVTGRLWSPEPLEVAYVLPQCRVGRHGACTGRIERLRGEAGDGFEAGDLYRVELCSCSCSHAGPCLDCIRAANGWTPPAVDEEV